jgi:hypothetical protein
MNTFKNIVAIAIIFSQFHLFAYDMPWGEEYQRMLIEKASHEMGSLSLYPALQYPNNNYEEIASKYPHDKILLFGYGSLLNPESASRSVSPEAVKSMHPVVAFGFKRLFNYKASNVSRWGNDLPSNERAMLNIEPMSSYQYIINGAVMEITQEDLAQLVAREKGYDLVPILVADWYGVLSKDPNVQVHIAYTFLVPDELRDGIDYTQTKYYPVRGYLHATQAGAANFGDDFLEFWNGTTYLSDGTTLINQWDQNTFSEILDTQEP